MASSNQPKAGRALAVFGLIIAAMVAAMVGMSTYVPKLGLDLSGGTSVTLTTVTPQGKVPPEDNVEEAVGIIRQRVNALGVSEAEVTKQGPNILVAVPGAGQREVVQQVGQTAKLRFRQVLLAQPVSRVPPPAPSSSQGSGEQPSASTSPSPAQSAPSRPRPLSQVLRDQTGQPSPPPDGQQGSPQNGSGGNLSPEQRDQLLQQLRQRQGAARQQTSGIDEDVLAKFRNFQCKPGASRGRLVPAGEQIVACNRDGTVKYVLAEAKVAGTAVTGAQAQPPNPRAGAPSWYVTLEFDGAGTKKWAELTRRVTNLPPPRDQVAIVLDGAVVSAPQIESAIPGGRAQISGNFTQQSASDLATVLKYGSLPLKFEKSEIRQISATLGADKLRAGLLAGGLGLILVVVYSLLHYRALGIVSVVGLAVAMALSYAAVVLLGVGVGYRLSIAGVTGLIVAIGITVDSFVVYFERLRDEIREGHTPRLAVERGWVRARRTILSADTVSFLAAAVLWVLAVGGVKGFAFTLGLTTLVDVLVVFLFTKPILTVLARRRFFGMGHPLSGLDPRRLGARRPAPAPSAASRGASAAREV